MTDPDEAQLSNLAKKMLATPHKNRDESKVGKSRFAPKSVTFAEMPKINLLRGGLERHSGEGGKHFPSLLVYEVLSGFPDSIFKAIGPIADGTGNYRFAVLVNPSYALYLAFATEYWLHLVGHELALPLEAVCAIGGRRGLSA
jgi:hypothetical protein